MVLRRFSEANGREQVFLLIRSTSNYSFMSIAWNFIMKLFPDDTEGQEIHLSNLHHYSDKKQAKHFAALEMQHRAQLYEGQGRFPFHLAPFLDRGSGFPE